MPKTLITVDPRLLSLIGSKLYSGHPLPIVVRELMQNARDACIRAGVTPDIKIDIRKIGEETLVTCTDNGIGMTDKQLVEDFLCLGNTSKMQELGAVGGFGIAKAAIMRNPKWHVHSLDNYMDESFLADGRDVEKREMREGTEVGVTITENIYTSALYETMRMIYLSDVSVGLEISYQGSSLDAYAGLRLEDELLLLAEGDEWQAFRLPVFSLPGPGGYDAMTQKNYTFYRLGGLVQFSQASYSSREYNILIELAPKHRPDTKEYPLTMSREGLSGPSQIEIEDFVRQANIDPYSTEITAEDKVIDVDIRDGYLMHGRRHAEEAHPGRDTSIDPISFEELIAEETREEHKHQRILLKNYKPSPEYAKRDEGILAVWREMILECADYRDTFGIGLINHDRTEAARFHDEDGHIFYLLNPTVLDKTTSKRGKVLLMHHMATHETAHMYVSQHDEKYVDTQSLIFRETIEPVILRMKEYVEVLV